MEENTLSLEDVIVIRGNDFITNNGADGILDLFTLPTDWYLAVGSGTTTGSQATMTALVDEFYRVLYNRVTANYGDDTVRISGTITATQGNGVINEIGLFRGNARRVDLHTCDVLTNWTTGTGNSLSLDTTTHQEGTAAIKATGSNSLRFRNTALSPAYGGNTFTTADRLQLWYYISDTTKVSSSIQIIISSSATIGQDQYSWNIPKSSLSNGWNYLSLPISDATAYGSPNLNAIVRFQLEAISPTASYEDEIDWIRLFGKSGTLWARNQLDNPFTKFRGNVLVISWDFLVIPNVP